MCGRWGKTWENTIFPTPCLLEQISKVRNTHQRNPSSYLDPSVQRPFFMQMQCPVRSRKSPSKPFEKCHPVSFYHLVHSPHMMPNAFFPGLSNILRHPFSWLSSIPKQGYSITIIVISRRETHLVNIRDRLSTHMHRLLLSLLISTLTR